MGRIAHELTALEQQILLAVVRLYPQGYGVSIRNEIDSRTGRKFAFGSIYMTLGRLRSRGFVISRESKPTAKRGRRRKLHFRITAHGKLALKHALQSLDALRSGTDFSDTLASSKIEGDPHAATEARSRDGADL